MTSADQKRRISGDPSCYVADGPTNIGFIFDRGPGRIATLNDRLPLGRFKDWREASRAIGEARRQGGEA